MAKQARKPFKIVPSAVVAGKRYKLGASTDDSRTIMAMIDDHVEVVDPKLSTGVVDIPAGLFLDLNWSKGQASIVKKQIAAKSVETVTLEFLAA